MAAWKLTRMLRTSVTVLQLFIVSTCAAAGNVTIVREADAPRPVEHALRRLTAALQNKQQAVATARSLPRGGQLAFVIGIAGQSPIVNQLLEKCPHTLAEQPESLLVHRDRDVSPHRVLVAGRDARGLAYALLEVARQIELAGDNVELLDLIREARQSP